MSTDQASLLYTAAQSFERACLDETPLLNAIYGIRSIILACNLPEQPSSPETVVKLFDDLIFAAAPRIAQAVTPALEDETVYLGLAAAASLLREVLTRPASTDGLTQSCLDHAALLACELDVLYRRREIERRGDYLRRNIAYRRFEALTSFGQTAH
jgi:hypothetical protein